MSGHTPGPWSYRQADRISHGRAIRGAMVLRVKKGGTTVVADLTGPDSDANARLMAAAPELLDALREAYAAMEPMHHEPVVSEALDAARAAIAKAGGAA